MDDAPLVQFARGGADVGNDACGFVDAESAPALDRALKRFSRDELEHDGEPVGRFVGCLHAGQHGARTARKRRPDGSLRVRAQNFLADERADTVDGDELRHTARSARERLFNAVCVVDAHGVGNAGFVLIVRRERRHCGLSVGVEEGLFVEAPEFLVAFVKRASLLDAPDDDGVAARFRPQLGSARQTQQTLGLAQVAAKAERQPERVIASREAFAGEYVVDEGRVEFRFPAHVRPLYAARTKQLEQVVFELALDGLPFIKVGFRACCGEQTFEQVFSELFGGHARSFVVVRPAC